MPAPLPVLLLASAALAADVAGPAETRAGEWTAFQVTGGTPGERVLLFAAPADPASTENACPDEIAGTCLDLPATAVAVAGIFVDDAGGGVVWASLPIAWGADDLVVQWQVATGTDPAVLGPVGEIVVRTRTDPWGVFSLAGADAKLIGENPGDLAGFYVSPAGDVNGDGFDDILVGARGFGPDTGAVYLVNGPMSGPASLRTAPARLIGESDGDVAGYRLAPIGDPNADGFDDFLVASFKESAGGTNAAAVYLVAGPVEEDGTLAESAGKLVGEDPKDHAGYGTAAGDVDGDGLKDAVLGAYGAEDDVREQGVAYVVTSPFSGQIDLADADARLVGGFGGDKAGTRVASCDTDGDGKDDVIVGSQFQDEGADDAGAVYVMRGPLSGTRALEDAEGKIYGVGAGNFVGLRTACAGDVDADGMQDVLAGGYVGGLEQAPTAWLFRGPVDGHIATSTADSVLSGAGQAGLRGIEVAGAGDVDGDGFDDVLVGAKFEDNYAGEDAGSAFIATGSPSGDLFLQTAASAWFTGEGPGDFLGYSVSTAGDTNADGFADVLLGAYGYDGLGILNGGAYVFLGASRPEPEPEDTDADTDTDAPDTDAVAPPVTMEDDKDGCGCAARPSGVGLAPWLVALALVGSRRLPRQSGTIPT